MRRIAIAAIAAWLLAGCLTTSLHAADTKSAAPPPALKVGDVAPDFKLQYFDGSHLKEVTLEPISRQEECCAGLLHLRLHRRLNASK